MRLSQEMDWLMSTKHSQINRVTCSAINDRVIPAIQNIMSSLCSRQPDTESGMSGSGHENSEQTSGLKTKIAKKDSMSAFDLRDTGDLSPYTCSYVDCQFEVLFDVFCCV